MAHVQKNTKAACGNLFEHYGRALDNTKAIEQRKYNTNIDVSRTHLNYNLAPYKLEKIQDQTELLRKRLSEVKCQKRADVNVMCSWVVTIPKDLLALHPEKEKDFFKETYNFLENRYGKENVISSWVHLDETTPHMHFAFVPVTHDKKKDIDKVSAKLVLNRTELNRFHKDLKKYLEQKLGCECNVLNGATVNGNKTIQEMKIEKLTEETKEKEKALQINSSENRRLLKENYDLVLEKLSLKNEIEERLKEKNRLTAENEKLNSENKNLKKEIEKNRVDLDGGFFEEEDGFIIRKGLKSEVSELKIEKENLEKSIFEFKKILENAKKMFGIAVDLLLKKEYDKAENWNKLTVKKTEEKAQESLKEPLKTNLIEEVKVKSDELQNLITRRRSGR